MKFCFWGSIAKGLQGKPIGGGEQQLALIAKYINKLGHEVFIIDFDVLSDLNIEGVNIISLKKRTTSGLKFLTFYKILKEIKADVYYARIRSSIHLIALFVAHKNKARFVYHLASDLDALRFKERVNGFYLKISPFQKAMKHLIQSEMFFPIILRKADLIICQNENQYQHLDSKIKKKNLVIINNLFEYNESDSSNHSLLVESSRYFIFIGSLDLRKGINELKRVINSNPDQLFYVIGKPRDKHGFQFVSEMKYKDNVRFYGHLSHNKVMKYLSHAKALINTSLYEGFSNAFIEAWSVGVPVFSLYSNPSNVMEKFNLGKFYNGDLKKMSQNLAKDSEIYFDANNMINYVKKTHEPFINTKKIIERIQNND